MHKGKLAAWIGAGALLLAAPVVTYYEGLHPGTYADPVGIPTICYGHTGSAARPGNELSVAECEQLLDADLRIALGHVARCIRVDLQPHQVAALTSFAFNVGGGALCGSTLARMANAGAPASQWCAQLSRWVYAGGIKLRGLERRRAAERALCEGRSA